MKIEKVLGEKVPHCSSSATFCFPRVKKDMFELSVMRGAESSVVNSRHYRSEYIEVQLAMGYDLGIYVRILENHKSYKEAKERANTKDVEWFYKVVFESLEPLDILNSFNTLYTAGVKQGKLERSAEFRKLLGLMGDD